MAAKRVRKSLAPPGALKQILLALFTAAPGLQPKAAGLAHPQFRQQFAEHAGAGFPGDSVQEKLSGFKSQLVLRQFDGCQSGAENPQPGVVIEADQTEVFRA